MMKRMQMPLAVIRKRIRDDEGKYNQKDIDLFATADEIGAADIMLI